MARRRTYTRPCARTGCPERSFVEYTARRDLEGVSPTCQVTPGVPCHDDGRARHTVHARRYTEAEETAA